VFFRLVCSNVEVEVGFTKVFEERPRFCWGQQPKTANNTSRRQPQNERVNVQTSVASFSVFFKSCFVWRRQVEVERWSETVVLNSGLSVVFFRLVCSNVEVEVGVTKVFEERPRFCWGQQPKTANNTSRRQPQNERVNVQTSVASFSVFFKSCFCLTKTSRSRTMNWNGCPKLRTVWRVFCWGFSRIRNANQECAEIVVTNNVKRSGLWWIEDGLRMRKCSARKKTKSFFISNSTCIDGWCLRWMEILACADEREMCVGFAFACFSCREKRPGENLVEVKNRKTCKTLKKSGKLWLNLLNLEALMCDLTASNWTNKSMTMLGFLQHRVLQLNLKAREVLSKFCVAHDILLLWHAERWSDFLLNSGHGSEKCKYFSARKSEKP